MSHVLQAGFGARLRVAREAKAMALSDVASKLKLSSRQIEAIEVEDLTRLPSDVFVRGFVRNYARLVGLDPSTLITTVEDPAVVSEAIAAPSAGLEVSSNDLRRWLIYPLLALVVFLVLVAGLYHWLRQGEDTLVAAPPGATETFTPAPNESATPVPEGGAPVVDTAVTPLALPNTPSNTPPNTEVAPLSAPPVSLSPSIKLPPKPTAPEAIVLPPNTGTSEADKAKSAPRTMRFEPGQDAWIQVVDAKGNRFSKLVAAGTSETFKGEPPFRLVVGEAALVKLTYNGRSVDLTPFIGQKVARLTLE